jgi:hypothetical protein
MEIAEKPSTRTRAAVVPKPEHTQDDEEGKSSKHAQVIRQRVACSRPQFPFNNRQYDHRFDPSDHSRRASFRVRPPIESL